METEVVINGFASLYKYCYTTDFAVTPQTDLHVYHGKKKYWNFKHVKYRYTKCQQTHTKCSFKHCSLGHPHDLLLLIFVHFLRKRNQLSLLMIKFFRFAINHSSGRRNIFFFRTFASPKLTVKNQKSQKRCYMFQFFFQQNLIH
jgi:hypothetical protein